MSGLIKSLTGLSWQEFSNSSLAEEVLFYPRYALCALFTLTVIYLFKKENRKQAGDILLLLSSLGLIFLAFLYYKDHFTYTGQFIEYSLQFGSPLFLYLFTRNIVSEKQLIFLMKIAVSLAFVGHGLYAFGFYPVPVKFVEMTCSILPMDESVAKIFLRTAGVLDFITAIGIYWRKIERPLLAYAAIWGLFTAMARITAYFDPKLALTTMHQWWYESFLRLPHMLIPLLLFVLIGLEKKKTL